jgi:hypothetical protein
MIILFTPLAVSAQPCPTRFFGNSAAAPDELFIVWELPISKGLPGSRMVREWRGQIAS